MNMEADIERILREHEIFQLLGEAAHRRLVAAARPVHFSAGEALIREGEFNDALMLLLRGRAQVESGDGGVIARVGAGVVLGEISASGMSLPVANVVAVEEVEALAFPIETVSAIAFDEEAFLDALRELGMRRVEAL